MKYWSMCSQNWTKILSGGANVAILCGCIAKTVTAIARLISGHYHPGVYLKSWLRYIDPLGLKAMKMTTNMFDERHFLYGIIKMVYSK